LQASGVPTEFKQFDGTFHGFVTIAMGLPQSAEALKMSVQALRKAFGMA
jgi:acetyl esterase/lipase